MKKNLALVGGVCSLLVGASYVVVGGAFLAIPAEQLGQGTAEFIASYVQTPMPWTIMTWAFALGGLVGFGAVPAISGLVEDRHEGVIRWTSGLAVFGFGVTALSFFWVIATTTPRVEAFQAGNDATRAAIVATESLIFLDPQGWFRFGCIGLWSLVVGVAGLRNGGISKAMAGLSIVGAILYWVTLAGEASGNIPLVTIGAGLGGCVVAPIFYTWFGVVLLRRASRADR